MDFLRIAAGLGVSLAGGAFECRKSGNFDQNWCRYHDPDFTVTYQDVSRQGMSNHMVRADRWMLSGKCNLPITGNV
jgi:hypothetical protein